MVMSKATFKKNEPITSPVLQAFADQNQHCWLCGTHARNTWPPKICIHHICRGTDREASRETVASLIATCTRCHEAHLDGMPVVRQLALKKIFDPAGYDRVAVNIIRSAHNLRGPQPDAIGEADVEEQVDEIEKMIAANGENPYPRWTW